MATEEQVQAAARVIHEADYDAFEGPCDAWTNDTSGPLTCRCVRVAKDALKAADSAGILQVFAIEDSRMFFGEFAAGHVLGVTKDNEPTLYMVDSEGRFKPVE